MDTRLEASIVAPSPPDLSPGTGTGDGGSPQGRAGLAELCGVRETRGGPVRYVAVHGLKVSPGQLVVVAHGAEEALATVVVGSGQILEAPPGLTSAGRVVRMASSSEQRAFGRRSARGLGLLDRASGPCRAQGAAVVDGWLDPTGSQVTLVLSAAPPRGDGLARELTALLGVDVTLRVRDAMGREAASSGAMAAGLPLGGSDWLVPPGAAPVVLDIAGSGTSPTAGAFIERLFPAADQWPPPRRRREHGD